MPGMLLLSLPSLAGREWALPKLVSASFPVCAAAPVAVPTQRSSCCLGKWLPGPVGSTNGSCCCFHPLLAPQPLSKREFVSFSLKPGKQRQICLGNFFCPSCLDLVLPVEGTGINPVIMCFLCHKLLLFKCLVTSNLISVQHNSISEFSSGANSNVVSLHTVQLWDACLEDASVQLKTQPVKLIPI